MMLPEYEKIAEIVKNTTTKNIIFGRIDVSQNDVTDLDAKRYPAVKVYKEGMKHYGYLYEGPRTVSGLATFLLDHSPAFKNLV